MCFGIRHISDPLLAADYKKNRNEYGRLLKSYVHDAVDDGEILIDKSSGDVPDLVFAVLDGVCIAALFNPEGYPIARGIRIVEAMIERLANEDGAVLATTVASSQRKPAKGAAQ